MRRLSPLVPVVVVAVVAGLLAAHDATWSVWLAVVLFIAAGFGGLVVARGRFGALIGLVAGAGLGIATAAAASGLWLTAFGTTSPATVTHVRAYNAGKGLNQVEDYSLALPSGEAVAGPLRQFEPGSYHVGSRVDVVYDPTGVIRFPTLVGQGHHARDAVFGPVAMVVALGLLVFVRLRRPLPPPPGGTRLANVRVADLQRRLAAERGDTQGGPAVPAD